MSSIKLAMMTEAAADNYAKEEVRAKAESRVSKKRRTDKGSPKLLCTLDIT